MEFSNRTKRFLSIAAMLLLAAAVPSAAPVGPSASEAEMATSLGIIRGVVRDYDGSPIADASVAIFSTGASKLLKQVTSGADGSYVAKIVPGTYTVLAVAHGFNPVTLFGVEVGRSAELTYGFKLERSGSGNTLPEKRLDRNSSKWRVRSAQTQRSIYQNSEGDPPVTDVVDEAEPETARPGSAVVETYFAGTKRGNVAGLNFATMIPVSDDAEVVVAGQAGAGRNVPLRLETAFAYRPNSLHQLRLNAAGGRLGTVAVDGRETTLGQVSLQASDEWKVRDGMVLVLGIDYSRFLGAGADASLTPRIGVQYDLDARTRLRGAVTTQTEERTWADALDLEGTSLSFVQPAAVDDLVVENGRARMNRSRRLEFGIERILDNRSSVEANAFFDTSFGRGVALSGFGFNTLGGDLSEGFVANQLGNATGVRVVYTRRMSGPATFSGGYSFGSGQKLSVAGIADPSHIFDSDYFHSFFAQLAVDLDSGTNVRTIYRLSPEATVFAIDPFRGRLAIFDPGLSVTVTQSLPTLGLPFRAQAVIDARNLFDNQPGVATEEGSLILSGSGRALRGGIQVRF